MRSFFLAWLMLALLLLGLGRLAHAGDRLEVAGFLTATDQEAIDGYFSLGGDAVVVVKRVKVATEPDRSSTACHSLPRR